VRNFAKPTFLADSVWAVKLDALVRLGIRAIILDLDNTIVDWNQSWLRPQVREWVSAAQERGLGLCLVSNALRSGRVRQIASQLGALVVLRAGKPFPGGFRRALEALGANARSTCAIGDQVFTDVVGANWSGITSILVEPLSPRESPHTRLIRLIERPLRRRWMRQGVKTAAGLTDPMAARK